MIWLRRMRGVCFSISLLSLLVLSLGCSTELRQSSKTPVLRQGKIFVVFNADTPGGPLTQELNVLPGANSYTFQARFGSKALWETIQQGHLLQDDSRMEILDLLTGVPYTKAVSQSAIAYLDRKPRVGTPYDLRMAAPAEGGAFVVALKVRQVHSEEGPTRLRWLPKPKALLKGQIEANVLLPTPSRGNYVKGRINDYEIGVYPDPHSPSAKANVNAHLEKYQVPDCFYRVDRKTAPLKISPHFRLGDFDIDYDYLPGEFPQYIALDLKLVDKLERLLARMNARGYRISTFHILAGYRSPKFNEEYKRADEGFTLTEEFSQHLYGRGVDMIVDEDHDGKLDDLNEDGKITIDDARVILKFVDEIDREALDGKNDLLGGAGVYYRHDIPDRKVQTPYIHLDTRGFADDNGRPVRWVGKK